MSGAPAAGGAAGGAKAFTTNRITLSGDTDTVTIDIVADNDLAEVPRWDLIKDGTACYSALEKFIETKPLIHGTNLSKLNQFKTFKGMSPASSFAKSKAQSVIRDKFINQLSIANVEARSYDSPFITPAPAPAPAAEDEEMGGGTRPAAAGGGAAAPIANEPVQPNTLYLKSLNGIRNYFAIPVNLPLPPSECDTCKRRTPASFTKHDDDNTQSSCIDLPIITDRHGYQIDNLNFITARITPETDRTQSLCQRVEDQYNTHEKVNGVAKTGQNARIFLNRIAKFIDGASKGFHDVENSLGGTSFRKGIFNYTIPISSDDNGHIMIFQYILEFTYTPAGVSVAAGGTAVANLRWDRLLVSKDGTQLFDINLSDVDLKVNSPKSWAMEISSAVENAFLLKLLQISNGETFDEKLRDIHRKLESSVPKFTRNSITEQSRRDEEFIRQIRDNKILVRKIFEYNALAQEGHMGTYDNTDDIIIACMFLKTISDELMSAPCYADIGDGFDADTDKKMLISATTDQVQASYVLANRGPVVVMCSGHSQQSMVDNAVSQYNFGDGFRAKRQQFINDLEDGNLTFNKYGILMLLNSGEAPRLPSVDEIKKLADNVHKEFSERIKFQTTIYRVLPFQPSGGDPENLLIGSFRETYDLIQNFLTILYELKNITVVSENSISAYKIITHMMLMNTRAQILPPDIVKKISDRFNTRRTPRLSAILNGLKSHNTEDFKMEDFIIGENTKFSETMGELKKLRPFEMKGGGNKKMMRVDDDAAMEGGDDDAAMEDDDAATVAAEAGDDADMEGGDEDPEEKEKYEYNTHIEIFSLLQTLSAEITEYETGEYETGEYEESPIHTILNPLMKNVLKDVFRYVTLDKAPVEELRGRPRVRVVGRRIRNTGEAQGGASAIEGVSPQSRKRNRPGNTISPPGGGPAVPVRGGKRRISRKKRKSSRKPHRIRHTRRKRK